MTTRGRNDRPAPALRLAGRPFPPATVLAEDFSVLVTGRRRLMPERLATASRRRVVRH